MHLSSAENDSSLRLACFPSKPNTPKPACHSSFLPFAHACRSSTGIRSKLVPGIPPFGAEDDRLGRPGLNGLYRDSSSVPCSTVRSRTREDKSELSNIFYKIITKPLNNIEKLTVCTMWLESGTTMLQRRGKKFEKYCGKKHALLRC